MSINLNGLISATVTPMHAEGRIDEEQLRHYIEWISIQGPVALAINVDTGEGLHLTHDEKVRVLEVVVDSTELPVVAGVAGPFTEQAVKQAQDYKRVGSSALLVFPIPAYLSSPLDPRIPVDYHRRIGDVGLPMLLFQLQPALGGANFEPDVLAQLIEVDGVIGMKEASFDARRYVDTLHVVSASDKYRRGEFVYLTGNDNFILESFMLGCTGALLGFGAIMVSEQAQMISAWQEGRIDEARELGRNVQRLADTVFAPPVANYRARIKEVLVMTGILEGAHVRSPLTPIGADERALLREVLVEVGQLEGVPA